VLLSASAVGIYGHRGDMVLGEEVEPGEGFLAEVCLAWEAAAEPAREAGIRVVHPRIGVVLDPRGGALAMMQPAFKLGAGGRLGDGRQWLAWIGLDDAVSALAHLLFCDDFCGPVNLVAPEPATNAQLTRTLGRVLHRPTLLPVPRTAAKVALGEMADEMLFYSARCSAQRLESAGYRFRQPQLEALLRHSLGVHPTT
jgi:hypothetical protein